MKERRVIAREGKGKTNEGMYGNREKRREQEKMKGK